MMKSPADEYRALMEQVATPSSVHEGILAEVERTRREERRRGTPQVRSARPAAPRARRRRTLVVACACACALAAAVALTPLGEALFRPLGGGPAGSAVSSFSVRAYASATRTLVPPGPDGMIVFDRTGSSGMVDKASHLKYGTYTGCMFTVEGDDIVRVQATTSKGMLYRTSHETVNGRDNPEQVAELDLWKPSKVGLGEHYGLYEDVRIIDGFGLPDPDRDVTVRLTKLLGSTIDLPISADDDGDAKSFGLWTNEDYGEVDESDPMAAIDAVFDLFEGETITVTAYFEDGSCATQTIELHAADFKAQFEGPEAFYGYDPITVYPEIVDPATMPYIYDREVTEDYAAFALHSLYAVIVDENDDPHPFPLDNANEWIDKTVPFTFERRDTWMSAGDATIDVSAISEADGTATFRAPADSLTATQDAETFPLEVTNLRIERSEQLPFGMAPEDTLEYGVFRGDLAYANKVTEETLGYRIEDDGTLTSGFSYRTVTFEVANASDVEVSLYTAALGSFAVLDDAEGHFSTLGASAVWETGYDGATNSGGGCALAPGEVRELTVVYVVPDELDQQGDPLFLFNVYGGSSAAFRIKSLL